jgi:hypothetical protein
LPSDQTQVLNMRAQSADEITTALQNATLEPNLPSGKATAPSPNELPATSIVMTEPASPALA